MKPEKKETLSTLLGYLRAYRGALLLSLILALIVVAATLSVPVLVGQCVDLVLGGNRVAFEPLLKRLMLIGALAAATALGQWLMGLCNNRVVYGAMRDIRVAAFERLERVSLRYLDEHPYGETLSRVMTDVEQIGDGLILGFSQFFTGLVTIVGTLGFMFSLNPLVAGAVVLLTPLSLFTARFISRRTYRMFAAQARVRGEQTALVDEMLDNQKLLRAFGGEARAQQRFDALNEEMRATSLKAIFYSSLTNPTTRFVNALVYAVVGVLGALLAARGDMTVGELSCFLSYANQFAKPFNEISGVFAELQNALACAGRTFQLLMQPPETPDAPDAARLCDVRGDVIARDVSFSYTPDKPFIEGFSLDVTSGQRIAIVGPTGCGKTTLINLLMRFYDADAGSIFVDGFDIRRVTRESLRKSYGMVLQETWLRAGTVADNLTLGRGDITTRQMIKAAKQARAHSFIMRLPNGYDTVLSEDGGSLSQGQKQLLCIARVMLDVPPMLILDEATSSIDTRTEQLIQAAFAEMMRGRTSFIVAHRLSTIRSADLILVMRDGRVIERGTHESLLALGGFYDRLYRSQFEQTG